MSQYVRKLYKNESEFTKDTSTATGALGDVLKNALDDAKKLRETALNNAKKMVEKAHGLPGVSGLKGVDGLPGVSGLMGVEGLQGYVEKVQVNKESSINVLTNDYVPVRGTDVLDSLSNDIEIPNDEEIKKILKEELEKAQVQQSYAKSSSIALSDSDNWFATASCVYENEMPEPKTITIEEALAEASRRRFRAQIDDFFEKRNRNWDGRRV